MITEWGSRTEQKTKTSTSAVSDNLGVQLKSDPAEIPCSGNYAPGVRPGFGNPALTRHGQRDSGEWGGGKIRPQNFPVFSFFPLSARPGGWARTSSESAPETHSVS